MVKEYRFVVVVCQGYLDRKMQVSVARGLADYFNTFYPTWGMQSNPATSTASKNPLIKQNS